MAGHSQFKNIMHRKKAVDAKRSNVFSKHARLIMNAARGGADPASNVNLRYAVDRARAVNMSRDAIERAIAKGSGTLEGVVMQPITYEGYGPGGVAILVDTLTDNRNRTVGDVRLVFSNHGGVMGDSGSVAWNFERKALFFVAAEAAREDLVMDAAMTGEAEDCRLVEGGFDLRADPSAFGRLAEALASAGFKAEKAEIAAVPKTTIALEDPGQVRLLAELVEALEELDDVQATATNLEWTDAALKALDDG